MDTTDEGIFDRISRLRPFHTESPDRVTLIRAVEERSRVRAHAFLADASERIRIEWFELTSPYFAYYLNTWVPHTGLGGRHSGFMSPESGDQEPQHQQLVSFNKKTILSVAMDLGVRDVESLSTVLLATMYGGIYSVLLDAAVDHRLDPQRTQPHHLYFLHLLSSRYHEHLALLEVGHDVWGAHDQSTYAALLDEELYHVGLLSPYSDLSQVTDKCAPLKTVAYGVLKLAGRVDLRAQLDLAIDDAAAGMLLTDDLFDWEDDFRLGRITFPIQAACEHLEITSYVEAQARRDDVLREIYFGVTYHRIVETIVRRFYRATTSLEPISPTAAAYIAENLDQVWRSWKAHTDAITATLTS